ncbi:unnamed protein product [Phytomonas sp. Hart1]|nr:unnamed protein product [Phytomonas sp. Hart1]|eukprot:CCW69554.1 unnamed protein product [Phytomonas sp. isolate Hart1]
MNSFVSMPDSPNLGDLSELMDSKVPKESIVPQSVDDMFDLVAPSLQMPVVARLVPFIVSSHESIPIHQDDGVIVLGRSKKLPPIYCIGTSEKVSSKHCEITVNVVTMGVTLRDTSTNGTYVNGERLLSGVVVPLNPGDLVSFAKPLSAPVSGFNSQAAASAADSVGFIFQRIREETTVDHLLRELTCEICRSVYIRPCSVLPCMHVFCASCISPRLRLHHLTCALCHVPIEEVQLTQKVQSRVEQLLAAEPSHRPSAEEVERREGLDDIPSAGRVVPRTFKRQRDDKNEHTHWDHEKCSSVGPSVPDNSGPGRLIHPGAIFLGSYGHATATFDSCCRHCQVPSAVDGFQCVEGSSHLICQSCRTRFPERPLCGRPQRCYLCKIPFCNLYYGDEGGCPAVRLSVDDHNLSTGLCSLYTHVFSAIPSRTFAGNTTEQAILNSYISDHNISLSILWDKCVSKLRDGKWKLDLTILDGPITVDMPTCSRCAEAVFSSLLFAYRRAIPSKELPDSVTERPNCWEGINCRLQFQKIEHAKAYNHACYQVKRKE